jgi:glycosyltransferase involved in cell wall biosynthesis
VFPTRFPRRLAFSPGLSKAARELAGASDVVHLHNLWQLPQYAGYQAARAAQIPYVVSPHGALDPYLRRHGRLRKRISMSLYQHELLARAALIHVTTEAEASLMADVVPDVPRAVVPCGAYIDEFHDLPPREQFRRTYLGGYDGPLVMFLGRLSFKKGLDVLIRAFALARRGCDCRLAIVGPDDEALGPELARIARELGVAEDVHFVGAVYGEARRAALASADVWALASHTENFGIAVIEAMAAGRAVAISTAVNVAPDVNRAEAGAVARPDPVAFGELLLTLLEDEPRRDELAVAGRRFAARYDWNVVAPQLLDMYRRAANGG